MFGRSTNGNLMGMGPAMDKESRYIVNDLTDVVEELAKIVREINPGANWGFVDFLLARVGRQLEEALQAAPPRS
jgi:hypothetical protein